MRAKIFRGTVFAAAAALFVALVFALAPALAQEQLQVLITWKAADYAPAEYAGKVLPGSNSPIIASVQIIERGKPVSIAGKTIRWYLDGSLIQTTTGNPTIVFAAPGRAAPSSFELSVQIPNYPIHPFRDELLFGATVIPMTGREVAIEAPYPGRMFSGSEFTVQGVPYFFNVKDPAPLAFTWTVNGTVVTSTEDKELLTVRFRRAPAPNTSVNVRLTVRDPSEDLFSGSKSIELFSR